MNRDIAEKWIADLRANPPQAKGQLFDGNGHCCLGRLCVLAGLEPERETNDALHNFNGEWFTLPYKVQEWAGIRTKDGVYGNSSLARKNDSGLTFQQIADIIAAHIDEL